MITLSHVTKRYPAGATSTTALEDASLKMEQGEFVAITGPSGSGKSTLLHLLAGLDRPTSGTIEVAGYALHSANEKQLTEYRRRAIGIIFQFFNLLPTMNARENITLPLLLQGWRESDAVARAVELLEIVGLSPRANHFPHQLSGGEMQRVAVARALAPDPAVLLADEPTGNLDTVSARKVLDLFQEIARFSPVTIVMVTHDESVAALARRRISVRDGRVYDETPVSKL